MKEGWKYSTIGDLCDKMNGLWKGKTEPFVKVGVIRNANFTKSFTLSFDNIEYLDVEAKQYKTRKLQKGDLIVEKSGGSEKQPVGRTVLFDREEGEYSFSNFTSVLRIKDRGIILPEFLYKYILFVYLRGDTRKMQRATTGIHNIEFDKFLSIPIPVPPLAEQGAIVEYLDGAFGKIDAVKANAEKAVGEAKALFQAALKQSLQPKDGWVEKAMKDVYDVRDGTHESPKYHEIGYPLVTSKNLRGGILDMSNVSFISEEDYVAINNRSKVDIGDVLFAMIGTIGNPVYVKTEPNYAIKNMALFKVPTTQSGEFLRYYLLNDNVLLKMQNEAKGTTQKFVSLGYLRNFRVKIPPLAEQQAIVAHLDALKAKVDRLQENFDKTARECDAMKQAILRQVFE